MSKLDALVLPHFCSIILQAKTLFSVCVTVCLCSLFEIHLVRYCESCWVEYYGEPPQSNSTANALIPVEANMNIHFKGDRFKMHQNASIWFNTLEGSNMVKHTSPLGACLTMRKFVTPCFVTPGLWTLVGGTFLRGRRCLIPKVRQNALCKSSNVHILVDVCPLLTYNSHRLDWSACRCLNFAIFAGNLSWSLGRADFAWLATYGLKPRQANSWMVDYLVLTVMSHASGAQFLHKDPQATEAKMDSTRVEHGEGNRLGCRSQLDELSCDVDFAHESIKTYQSLPWLRELCFHEASTGGLIGCAKSVLRYPSILKLVVLSMVHRCPQPFAMCWATWRPTTFCFPRSEVWTQLSIRLRRDICGGGLSDTCGTWIDDMLSSPLFQVWIRVARTHKGFQSWNLQE